MKTFLLPLLTTLAVLASSACAYNATGSAPLRTLIFEFNVAQGGAIAQSPNLAYYLVINSGRSATINGAVLPPSGAPRIYGPVPQSRPYPNPLSYLPFARDLRPDFRLDLTDNTPLLDSQWDTFFALYQDLGQMVLWQGQLNSDGTVNEKLRQLQPGREWGITGGTLQITLPLNQFLLRDIDADPTTLPATFNANLAVGLRAQGTYWNQLLVSRWGLVQDTFFTVPTTAGDQTIYQSGTVFPGVIPAGISPQSVTFVSYHYRITAS